MCNEKASQVLIVEDDASLRAALDILLSTCDYRCLGFASAEDFLASPELAKADCVVLDVDLPGASGLVAQRCLAQRGIDVPVLFISGAADNTQIGQAKKAGAFDFLLKPFDPECLLESIRRAVLKPLLAV
jgi:FixJ family two-component response regulator